MYCRMFFGITTLTRVGILFKIQLCNIVYYNWQACQASETVSGVYKFELVRYVYKYILEMCSVSTNGEQASPAKA